MVKLNLLLFLCIFFIYENTTFKEENDQKYFKQFEEFLKVHSNYTIYEDEILNNPKCLSAAINQVNFYKFVEYSDIRVYNFINFDNCLQSGREYFFIKYYLTEDEYSISILYSGFCIPSECSNFYSLFLNSTLNKKYFDYQKDKLKMVIKKVTIYKDDYLHRNNIHFLPTSSKALYIIIIFYCLLVLIISIHGMIYYFKDFSQFSNSQTSKNSKFIKQEIQIGQVKKMGYKIYKIFSININFQCLNQISNKIYNDNKLELFNVLKLLALQGVTLYVLFLNLEVNKIKPLNSVKLLADFPIITMSVLRMGYNSFSFLIIINSSIFSYKLLFFANTRGGLTLKDILYFYKSLIPKFFIFVFIICFFIFLNLDFLRFMNTSPLTDDRDFGIEHYFKSYKCFIDRPTLLYPFYLHYFNDNMQRPCFVNYLLLLSEFYLSLFNSFLFYFLYKFKSQILEVVVAISFLIVLILNVLSINELSPFSEYFLTFINIIYTAMKPDQLLFSSFLGLLLGITYHLHINLDSTSILETTYIPFRKLIMLNKFFFYKSNLVKKLIILISVVSIILMSTFLTQLILLRHNKYLIDFKSILIVAEMKVFSILICILILMLIYLENPLLVGSIPKIYYLGVSRSSTSYILLLELLVFSIQASNIMIPNMQLIKYIFLTLTSFIFISFSCLFLTVLVELPLRKIIKRKNST